MDLAGEQLENGTYAHRVVVVLLPRQTGKTTTALDLAIGRGLARRDYRAAYTAQTGQAASERMRDRLTELEGGPVAGHCVPFRAGGAERARLPQGSYTKVFTPKDGALRGSALDLVIVDEAQEFSDDEGRALDLTIMPTFTTRPNYQLVLIGTAGTSRSGYFRRYLDLARAGTPGYALVEYGAHDGDDVLDPDTWRARHPGLAAGLTTTATLATALTVMGEAGFVREYLNVWTAGADLHLDPLAWAACRATEPLPPGRPSFGVALSAGRATAAITAAVGNHCELVELCPPFEAAARLRALRDRWAPRAIILDRASPAGSLADELDRAGVPFTSIALRDYANGCADFTQLVQAGLLRHTPSEALDAAVAIADIRPVADGLWVWSRKGSHGSVAPLEAATLALWGASRVQTVRPLVVTG